MTYKRSEEIVNQIKDEIEPRHDVIYCNTVHEMILKEWVVMKRSPGGISSRSIDNIRILGLPVQVLPEIERVIVCQKGEVFDLAKDYRNNF